LPTPPEQRARRDIVLRIVNFQIEVLQPIAIHARALFATLVSRMGRLALLLALDRQKFDVKNERGIDANHGTGTPLAVG
jgi:hypothetical protein